MKDTSFTRLVFLTLAGLNSCLQESCTVFSPEPPPSVARSTLRIEVAKRGDIQFPTGLLKQTTYIEKPALCACDPNTEGKLFVLDAVGRSATQVNVHYGQSAGTLVEVRDGLVALHSNPGSWPKDQFSCTQIQDEKRDLHSNPG